MKIKKILPVTIALVVILAIGVYSWVGRDGLVRGLVISTDAKGYNVSLKMVDDADFASEVTINDRLNLTPCTFDNGTFIDQNGNTVTDDENYVKMYHLIAKTDNAGALSMAFDYNGGIPARCYVQIGNEWTELTSTLEGLKTITGQISFTLAFIVDAESYDVAHANMSSTANVTVHCE